MDTEAALLRAILLNPADDVARLVYADWLDEHDEPREAEIQRWMARTTWDGIERRAHHEELQGAFWPVLDYRAGKAFVVFHLRRPEEEVPAFTKSLLKRKIYCRYVDNINKSQLAAYAELTSWEPDGRGFVHLTAEAESVDAVLMRTGA